MRNRTRPGPLLLAGSLAWVACSAHPPPSANAIAGGTSSASTANAGAPTSDATAGAAPASTAAPFAPLRDRVLDGLLADEPATARDLGLHEFDGKVAPVSAKAVADRVARLRAAADALAAVDPASLGPDDALDRAELASWIAVDLFQLVDMDAPRKSPDFYEPLFGVSSYIDRESAPLPDRAARLVEHEEAALAEVAHVRENLTPPLSKPVAEVAARNFAGFATYLRGDVAKIIGPAGDEALRRRFAASNEALAKAATDLAAWFKKEAARGDQSHVLGPVRYAKLLRVQEGLDVPVDGLEAFEQGNEADLAANKKAYEDLLAQGVKPKPVIEAQLFATAGRMMQDARAYLVDHAIVTLAANDAPVVRETPPYERWNSASIEMSGPFDPARSAFYQLTIPDRSWPAKERAAYLGSLGDLLGTTIHEVYPGHFVQGRWAERAPTRVQKAFTSYSFVEGWAHYSEQMMIDEGFGKDDPANRLAMLDGALLRNCRFAASYAIHVKGMTVEQVEPRFVSDCHQDTATAHEQAVRGTFDPGYFAYTLGKLQILALRSEAQARLGARFSLQKFHDALLAHGAPPVALIHDAVLRQLGAL
ncbi:MAG TPA: DUF885 domain-containing protein [Polyangiaceae bacterium]|jgi:uncharacterized protein (DUF885 family)|nr:DUF885 domain-containing protein [Polyangiaceae bacterium]